MRTTSFLITRTFFQFSFARAAPANARWLSRLSRLGVDPRPWLEGIGTWVRAARDGRVVLLSLEDDPLAVLQMGAPFATCLAPGDFNYFSAVSNAADLNKRVLYARDPQGRVLGRCLLAISPRGEIVVADYQNDRIQVFSTRGKFIRIFAKPAGDDIRVIDHPILVAERFYHPLYGDRDGC